jgi:hypothetical protein
VCFSNLPLFGVARRKRKLRGSTLMKRLRILLADALLQPLELCPPEASMIRSDDDAGTKIIRPNRKILLTLASLAYPAGRTVHR